VTRHDDAADPTRREFFRTFGRQTVRNAGAVMGAAAELREAGGRAAREILELGNAGAHTATTPPLADASPTASFNSAYRLSGGSLLILDQRDLPGRVAILTCREPSEVASAIRLGAVNAGPVVGQLAAYAIALAAAAVDGADQATLDQGIHAAANTLRGARRDVHALATAVDRMEARYLERTADNTPDAAVGLSVTLREEADAITSEAQLAHAALGRVGAAAITGSSEPINLLIHGDMGPLSCGMVGTGTAILQALIESGRNVHVWVTEASPGMEGTRMAFELTQLDVPHTVIPDTAVSWLLSARELDGVLLRGDTVGANTDTLAPLGSLNVAHLAADAEVKVYVVAPTSAYAPATVDLTTLVVNLRSPTESGIRPSAAGDARAAIEVRFSPTTDVVPASLVSAFITDTGVQPGGRR
jgi:methylthioribose-1-phosphate isomerase